MMKRPLSFLIVLVLILAVLPTDAFADVIFEPWEDAFYDEHREDCEYTSRNFYAAGPEGTVTVYKSPESDRVQATIENDSIVWISHIYTSHEGVRWGYHEDWQNDIRGWVPMAYLDLIYDGISFETEFADRIKEEEGEMDDPSLVDQKVYFWQYPGSYDYVEMPVYGDSAPRYYRSYTDDEGRVWVQFSYYMGLKNYWVDLNDPMNPHEEFQNSGPVRIPSGDATAVVVPGRDNTGLIIAVATTVAVTAVLLILLKKKKA